MSFNTIIFGPNIQLDNVHAQNVTLDYADLVNEDIRYLTTADSSSPVVVNSTGGIYGWKYIHLINIDDNRILVTYSNTAGRYFSILDTSGNILKTETFLTTGDHSDVYVVKLEPNKFLVAYIFNFYGRCNVVEIDSLNNITIGISHTFHSAYTSNLRILFIDSTHVFIAYDDFTASQQGFGQILTINGSIIETNTEYSELGNDYTISFDVCLIDVNKIVFLYSTDGSINGDTAGCYAKILDINGTIIDNSNPVILFNNDNTTNYKMELFDTNKLFMIYSNSTGVFGTFYNVLTDIISVVGSKYINANIGADIKINILSATQIVYWLINASTNYIQYQILTVYNNTFLIEDTQNLIAYTSTFYDVLTIGNIIYNLCYLHISGGTYNTDLIYIDNITPSTTTIDYEQIWGDNTAFLADFENTLQAGSIITTDTISGWRVKRQAEDSSLLNTLADVSTPLTTYRDYLPRNNINYKYSISALSASGEMLGVEATDSVDFFGWILTDNTNVYKFDAGWDSLESGNITTNKDYYKYENYTKYPVTSFSPRNYRTGSLKTIPLEYNSTNLTYDINVAILNEIQAFIDNGIEKWLKNSAGEIFKIITSDFNYKYADKISTQPYEIQFNFIEVNVGEEI